MGQSYCALYVDAGYLLAAAATRITGTSFRAGIDVDHSKLLDALAEQAHSDSGLPLLRIQWYDAASTHGPSEEQRRIGALPRVKLRLGRISTNGMQKGVDLRLGLDIVNHARHGRVDRLYLVTGDDDLTEAVDEAQNFGAQVAVLAVPSKEGKALSVSSHLRQVCDEVVMIDEAAIDATVHAHEKHHGTGESEPHATASSAAAVAARVAAASTPDLSQGWEPKPDPVRLTPVYSSATGESSYIDARFDVDPERVAEVADVVCRKVVASWQRSATPNDHARILAARPSIPSELDRALLLDLAARLDISFLDDSMRHTLRSRFWEILEDSR